ncbi:MAG: hypothetical protein AAF170_12445 [Bacteroidota bacterium]
MNTSLRLLSLGLALAISAPALAQSSEAYVSQAVAQADVAATVNGSGLNPFEALQATLPEVPEGTNVLVLEQMGIGNQIDAQQAGLNNRVALTQNGDRNAFVLSQIGNNNLILASINGSDNGLITVNQSNDDNVYALYLDGDFAPPHTVTQTGGQNLATQVVGPGSTPIDIQQFGNGIEVLVERY